MYRLLAELNFVATATKQMPKQLGVPAGHQQGAQAAPPGLHADASQRRSTLPPPPPPSNPSDMSAADTQRRPSNRYIEYLHLYSRRARKTATGPTADGAGLLCGTRYHGRNTPLKVGGGAGRGPSRPFLSGNWFHRQHAVPLPWPEPSHMYVIGSPERTSSNACLRRLSLIPNPASQGKGVPPTDGKETPTMIGGLRIMSVPWHHHAETDVLNTRPRPATADGALGFRPSVRYFQTAFASSMQGGGAVVVEEVRASRGGGSVPGGKACVCRPGGSSWGAIAPYSSACTSDVLHECMCTPAEGPAGLAPSHPEFPFSTAPCSSACCMQEPEKRMVRRRGAQAPQDDITTTKRRVQIDCEHTSWCCRVYDRALGSS